MEINDPTHLTGHVCVDASRDEEKYQGFALSGCPEEDRRGDRHLSGTRQRLCVDTRWTSVIIGTCQSKPVLVSE